MGLRNSLMHCYDWLNFTFMAYATTSSLTFVRLNIFRNIGVTGFTIDKQGKRISASRVDSLRNLKRPNLRNDVEKMLGCFVFVAKWIKNFAGITAPLYSLLHKGVRFERTWSEIHEESAEGIASLR